MTETKKLITGVKTEITTEHGIEIVEVTQSKWDGFNKWMDKLPVNDSTLENKMFDDMQEEIKNRTI